MRISITRSAMQALSEVRGHRRSVPTHRGSRHEPTSAFDLRSLALRRARSDAGSTASHPSTQPATDAPTAWQ
jgi:hypothetical protein